MKTPGGFGRANLPLQPISGATHSIRFSQSWKIAVTTAFHFVRMVSLLSLALAMSSVIPVAASSSEPAEKIVMERPDQCQEACALDKEALSDMETGNYQAAIEKLKLAVVLHPNLYSAENHLAVAYANLAVSQRQKNELGDAEESYLESYRRLQQNYKRDNNRLASVCDGLAETEELLGKYKDAQMFRAKSVELNEMLHGKGAQCVLKRKIAYANCLRKCGDIGGAEKIEVEMKRLPPSSENANAKSSASPVSNANPNNSNQNRNTHAGLSPKS